MMGVFNWLKNKRKTGVAYSEVGVHTTVGRKLPKIKKEEQNANKKPNSAYYYPKYQDSSHSSHHTCAFCGKVIIGSPKIKDRRWWCGECSEKSMPTEEKRKEVSNAIGIAELSENNFERAKELANEAKKVANERKARYGSAVKSISEAEEILSEVNGKGVAVSDELLIKSKQAFDDGDYEEAIKYAKQSEDTTKTIQEESKPEIALDLPEETFPPNQWKKIDVTIRNTGSMHAKEIEIEPSGDIEFKRIPRIPQLNTNKTETITIAMKPTVAGDVPIDITLSYKDALDRDHTSSEEVWVTVADSTSGQAPPRGTSSTIEIKRAYEVLSNNDLRFGIRVTNSTDYAIMDVKTILNYPKTLFSLKDSEIQTLSNIDPHGKRTATYQLTPRACIHNEKIDATVFFKDHTGSSQNVPMRPKDVHCVCPYLKEKPMREGEFAQLADASERIQEGLLFIGIGVSEIAGFVKESCAHRLYVIGEHEVDTTKVVHLAGESLGEKAYYLLTAVIRPYEGITQVALRAYSDKPYGLHGFLGEMAGSLRHLVGSAQSAREIGVIEKKQVINIIDSVVQRTTFAGGVGEETGATGVNIEDSVVQRSEIGSTRRCQNCGEEVQAGEEFCTECGTRLG